MFLQVSDKLEQKMGPPENEWEVTKSCRSLKQDSCVATLMSPLRTPYRIHKYTESALCQICPPGNENHYSASRRIHRGWAWRPSMWIPADWESAPGSSIHLAQRPYCALLTAIPFVTSLVIVSKKKGKEWSCGLLFMNIFKHCLRERYIYQEFCWNLETQMFGSQNPRVRIRI